MKNERLHTDEQLKSITLKQIAIDAEEWPRKYVEQFFERHGLEKLDYSGRRRYLGSYVDGYTDCSIFCEDETKLTLPDALRWEELQKGEKPEWTFIQVTVDSSQDVIAQLRARIAELEAENKPEEEDGRVDFGDEVSFNRSEYKTPALIGHNLAKKGDEGKVLIARKGYKWVLEEDYYDGRNAVSLVKTDEK